MTGIARPIVKIGDEAPSFTLPIVDGHAGLEELSHSDYKGKKVIIFMWASW
jgi:peroxiredoxin